MFLFVPWKEIVKVLGLWIRRSGLIFIYCWMSRLLAACSNTCSNRNIHSLSLTCFWNLIISLRSESSQQRQSWAECASKGFDSPHVPLDLGASLISCVSFQQMWCRRKRQWTRWASEPLLQENKSNVSQTGVFCCSEEGMQLCHQAVIERLKGSSNTSCFLLPSCVCFPWTASSLNSTTDFQLLLSSTVYTWILCLCGIHYNTLQSSQLHNDEIFMSYWFLKTSDGTDSQLGAMEIAIKLPFILQIVFVSLFTSEEQSRLEFTRVNE